MHILWLTVIGLFPVLGLFYLYKDIRKVSNWKHDPAGTFAEATSFAGGEALSGAEAEQACHSGSVLGETGICDAVHGIDFGHIFHH
ncbi:hypothetical protein H6F88_01675 [Oculatella sp. FACHB-28]|uniref:hypothetical protein n=1 Tax=Oculatella sp. FACHB-28 TaxID=2692845 RepID=UPI0016845D81|nr:hypothetical protein [Oculatella sp. FACHB-28]MBD1867137.1 hypothetical protein [Cyanobacteria bacterium FACHB-471]MBD2054746.1 hypothetical protein [Oculatella sp. FACHB-28]